MKNTNEKNNLEAGRDAVPDDELRPVPPKAPGIVSIIIVCAMLIGALVIGVYAGPSIKEFISGLIGPAEKADAGAGDTGGHGMAVATEGNAEGTQLYTCSMHPWIVRNEPGQCPICAMDLIPIEPEKFGSEIAIDPVMLQNIGVRVQPVASGPPGMSLRTVGNVSYDETRIVDVNLRIDGWIEKVYVDSQGAEVRSGQPLIELYSPELYATREEYLLLWRNRERPGNAELLRAARTRLELYGIGDEEIERIERDGSVRRTMLIKAPAGGIVMEKNANQGLHVTPGQTIYRIADLSRVWVLASLYEYQLPYVSVGQPASISLPYLPGESIKGRIAYIYPYLDERSREVRVRLEFDNRRGLLKPGMFADVVIDQAGTAAVTLVPREAVIDTGARKVAIVSLGEGRFEPRTIETGRQAGDGMVEVLSGLEPGEQVVVSGQFLLDSESRMREALAKMMQGDLAGRKQPPAQMQTASDRPELPAAAGAKMATALDRYLAIQDSLYNNSLDGVAAAARGMKSAVDDTVAVEIPGRPHFWHQIPEIGALDAKLDELASADDLGKARVAFGFVGKALDTLLKKTGVPQKFAGRLNGWRCGMFEPAPDKGVWLQIGDTAHNPFFGSDSGMKSCHSEKWGFQIK